MDCLHSPFLSSDVDMDILTDTTPAPPSYDDTLWQWILIPEYAPVDHTPQSQKTPVQEPPPSANQYNSAFAAPPPLYTLSLHAGWDVNNCLPTYHHCPLGPINAMSDQTQDTLEIHSREPPHRAAISVATLLDKFERSLTLVADETPSSESDNWSNYNHQRELTPACIIQDELRIALHSPQTNVSDSPPFAREAAGSLGTLACFINFHDPSPRPFERASTERREGGQGQPRGDSPPRQDRPPACFLDLADQPGRLIEPASLLADTLAKAPVTRPAPRVVHPLARPRPPTPPPSRRPTKPRPSRTSSTNQRTTRLAANANTHQERIDPASKRAGGARVSRPLPVRYGRNRREEEEDTEQEGEEIRPDRTKRTRFVMPDREDEGEQDSVGRLLARRLRTRGAGKAMDGATSASSRRTSVTGPLRSILRNARTTTMPYQKTGVRRRASVP